MPQQILQTLHVFPLHCVQWYQYRTVQKVTLLRITHVTVCLTDWLTDVMCNFQCVIASVLTVHLQYLFFVVCLSVCQLFRLCNQSTFIPSWSYASDSDSWWWHGCAEAGSKKALHQHDGGRLMPLIFVCSLWRRNNYVTLKHHVT